MYFALKANKSHQNGKRKYQEINLNITFNKGKKKKKEINLKTLVRMRPSEWESLLELNSSTNTVCFFFDWFQPSEVE